MAKAQHKLTVIPSFRPDKDVIDKLEQVLAKAREGEISMIAIATVDREGTAGRAFSDLSNTATMLGAIEMMKADIMGKLDG